MSTTEIARHLHSAGPTHRPTDPHANLDANLDATFDRPTATFPTGQWLADQSARRERLADLRADATPTELLPVTPTPRAPLRGTTARRHLRAALVGIALAAAILTGLQLYAAAGISSARQAALEQAAPAPAAQPDVRSDIQADWVTEDTGAAYDRTDPTASPLDLPRCTTSPDTPLPCLATISPDSRRAVVLEEDTSLTALVRR